MKPAAGPGAGAALTAALDREEQKLLACVHCGFCLSACPTYTRVGHEADSPRGRLHLMRAVVEERLEPGADAFRTHIDRCLGCRACETVCPSGVEYGFLLERARDVIAEARGIPFHTRIMLRIFGSTRLNAAAMAAGRLFRGTGIPALLVRVLPRSLGSARFGLAMLGASRPWPALGRQRTAPVATAAAPPADRAADLVRRGEPSVQPAAGEQNVPPVLAEQGRPTSLPPASAAPPVPAGPTVALLSGCVQEGLFARVNRATVAVLQANGCRIVAAPGQGCCGALHAHAGSLAGARTLARANVLAFEESGAEFFVANAAGCGAVLKEYGELLADDPDFGPRAHDLAARVRDVWELLVDIGTRAGAAVPLRVTYDAPCHLHHAQGITRAPLEILATIPELELIPLPNADECCGGAGIYGLLHPELGGRILTDKVAAIQSTGADVVVTPNPGCMMQIGAGLLMAGDERPVLHPIELVAESYRRLTSIS
jgi:glycolate oxidase iron-sulfur subunit